VRKPKVFLFDEPLSNLDAKLRVQMRAEISALHHRLQATMIYVTHDQVEAMTMGDKIVVMRDGVIQQIGDPLTLYNFPVNRFVAGFIGSPPMNFMTVKVTKEKNKTYIEEAGFRLHVSGENENLLQDYLDRELVFGIRPEDLRFDPNAKEDEYIKANVEVIEPLGAETHIYVNTGSHSFIARINPNVEVSVGDEVRLVPTWEKVVFFDMESEQAISVLEGVKQA
jgi:multiple sugar transport system ATP-binding protein